MKVRRAALLTTVGAAVFLVLSALLVILTFHAGTRVVTGEYGPKLIDATNPWFLTAAYLAMVLLGAHWIACLANVSGEPA